MKKWGVIVVLAGVLFSIAATAGIVKLQSPSAIHFNSVRTTGAAQTFIDQGKSYLQAHNILAARDQFSQAVAAEPGNQEANLLYGVIRVFAVVEDGQNINTAGLDSVREIFEIAGFVFQSFNIFGSTVTVPKQLPSTTPRTGAVLDFLKAKALPEVNGAIANLAMVTNTGFSSVIAPATIGETSGADITVDYADALVIKALLNAMKCNLNLLMVYGLDVGLPDIQANPEQLMTYKQFFQDSTFLTPKDTTSLTAARTALLGFIDAYNAASPLLLARSGAAHHLFVVDAPVTNEPGDTSADYLNRVTNVLADIKASLNGPHLFSGSAPEEERYVDLSKFFNAAAPINIRNNLSDCSTGTAMPDSTLSGLFPLGLTGLDAFRAKHGADLLGVVCNGRETPAIKVQPGSLYFSDTPDNPAPAQPVTIGNYGTASLHVSSIGLTGANGPDFTLTAGTCGSLAPILSPGASCSLSIGLTRPATPGSKSAALQIASDDISMPNAFVNINGSVLSAVTPDIRANGVKGAITVTQSTPVRISVGLDAGAEAGQNADWWLAASTQFGWYSYVYPSGWAPGINLCVQTPLFNLSPFETLNMTLPAGDYTFYFGVDMTPNGVLDNGALTYNTVQVHVTQ